MIKRYKIRTSATWREKEGDPNVYVYGNVDASGEPTNDGFFKDPTNNAIFPRARKKLLRTAIVEETQAYKFFEQFNYSSQRDSDNLSVKPTGELRRYVEVAGRKKTTGTKTTYVKGEYGSHTYNTTVNIYRLNWDGQRKREELRKEQKPDLTKVNQRLAEEIARAEKESARFFGAYHNWNVENLLSKLDI